MGAFTDLEKISEKKPLTEFNKEKKIFKKFLYNLNLKFWVAIRTLVLFLESL